MKSYKQIAAVKTSFRVLDLLRSQGRPVSGAEVAQALGLPHATAMSHLTTLEDLQVVRRAGDVFEIGPEMAIYWAEIRKRLETKRAQIDQTLKLING
ncbi:MAG: helix-turn-helix domain-containing protein [Desulfuromonadales bacterium]|nr:helix-turn-helix domain-containing protein [Desulfuromonadales bacterium]